MRPPKLRVLMGLGLFVWATAPACNQGRCISSGCGGSGAVSPWCLTCAELQDSVCAGVQATLPNCETLLEAACATNSTDSASINVYDTCIHALGPCGGKSPASYGAGLAGCLADAGASNSCTAALRAQSDLVTGDAGP
jgi:hypothetical protein